MSTRTVRETVRSFRGPLIALGAGLVLLIAATLLDRGGERSRDLALLLGVSALYVVLPLAVLWLIVVAVVRARSGRGPDKLR
jgi:NAD-dependent oxidoreductase involved in siderophore biosynthesis